MNIVTAELADGHCRVLMSIHLNKSKSTIRLKSCFNDISKILKKWNKIVLRSIGSEISNITSSLPLRSLLYNHFVALDTMRREVVMTGAVGSGRCHAHGGHGLLLRDGWLSLLIGPVAADRTRTKPFAIHRAQSFFSIATFSESDKTIST